ncbi:MAG: PAS domain S-box protein [Deltaproteobacteria bacterium]|nr:PAS domain S-box protein [Candidatus Tharpella sp.]
MRVKFSLYQKLLFAFVVVAVLPLLIGSGYFYKVLQGHLQEDVERVSQVQARAAAKKVEWQISEIDRSLKHCAGQYFFERNNSDGQLSWPYRQYPEIRKIVIVDSENRVVEALSRYGYLSHGMPSPLLAFATDYPNQRKIFFSQWQLEPQLVIVYPITSLISGKQKGYLFAELSLKKLFHAFPQQSSGKSELFLVNLKAKVVAHSDINHVLKGDRLDHVAPIAKVLTGAQSALGEYPNLNNEIVFGVVAKIEGLPLLVVCETPLSSAYALADVLRNMFISVSFFTLGPILLISWYLSRLMTRPIERLYLASEKIRSGSLELVAGEFPDDEIGAFAQCFNEMVVSLKDDRELREKAEIELRESEKHYRTIADYAYDMECWRDPEGQFIHVSPSCLDITGYHDHEFYANHLLMNEIVVDEDREIFVGHRHDVMRDGRFKPIEFRIHHKDGSIRWLNHICRPITNSSGDNLGVRGSNRDVTLRKSAEDFLAAERERLAVTLRSIGDGVITTDDDGRVTLLNPVAETLTGWSNAAALGRAVDEIFHIIHEFSRQVLPSPVAQVLAENQVVELANHALLISCSGDEVAVADSAAPIIGRDGQRLGVVLVFRDVRDEKRLQQERLRSEKLEAVGVLAGGIAHDFNNLLMGLQGSIDLVRLSYDQGFVETEKYLLKAENAIGRAVSLARQLLTFAKGGAPVKGEVVLLQLVEESAEFVLHGSQVKVVIEAEADIWDVQIDSGQISQVVNNLVTNARQAMDDRGIIQISITNLEIMEDCMVDLMPGPYVKVTVQDQGCGIDPEIISHIFEPYYTTKESGSGLGLATCYSIIANHDGHIDVTSEPGTGSTFTFLLPSTGQRSEKNSVVLPESSVNPAGAVGKGRVLLMDDEAVICEVVTEMLGVFGYEVVTVADGETLLETYRTTLDEGLNFVAVIMDLSIPGGMGGREAIGHLRELDAFVKVIVSSGYSQDPVMANFRAYGFNGMVAKPYKIKSLLAVLQDDGSRRDTVPD